MATLDDRTYAAVFSGLKSTAITAGIFFVGGNILHETLMRIRRYPDEDKARKRGEDVPDRGMEGERISRKTARWLSVMLTVISVKKGWAMGYLYRARTYVEGERAPDFGHYPLSWIVEAIKRKASYFEEHDVGADAVVYLRFLRGTRQSALASLRACQLLIYKIHSLLDAVPSLHGLPGSHCDQLHLFTQQHPAEQHQQGLDRLSRLVEPRSRTVSGLLHHPTVSHTSD